MPLGKKWNEMKGGKNEMDEQGNLESWDGFLGSNFLSADAVDDENHVFVVIKTELDTDNNRPILLLESQGVKAKFSLNVTNSNFLKNSGITSPNKAIGKKIKFRKVIVISPKTKKEVESLRIIAIE